LDKDLSMRITELKKNISKLVELTSDKDFLEMIFSILDDRAKEQNRDILDDLTDEQMKELDLSLEQIERGEVVEHEVVMKEIRQKISNAKKRKMV
jgi:predicted transcriptional regulator